MTEDMSVRERWGCVKLMGDIGKESGWCERLEERDGVVVVVVVLEEGLLCFRMSRKVCEAGYW